MNIFEYLQKQSRGFIITAGLLLIALIGVADYLTGADISASIFYLLPISIFSWYSGRSWGLISCVISTFVWFISDLAARTSYSHPLIHFWNMLAGFGFFWILSYIMSFLKISLEHEKMLARTDPLTGLFNRRHFNDLALAEINRMRRYNRPFTVAYIDIDDFKAVNDRYGHNEGDALLRRVAVILSKNLRDIDIIARLGGDELALLLPETTYEQGSNLFDKLREKLMEAMHVSGWDVTFSIGALTFHVPPDSIEDMLKRVDTLMYDVKRSSKNSLKHEMID